MFVAVHGWRVVPGRELQFHDTIAEVPPGNTPVFTMEVADDLPARARERWRHGPQWASQPPSTAMEAPNM